MAYARGPELRALRARARVRLSVVQAACARALRASVRAAQVHGRAFAAFCERELEPRVRALVLRVARLHVRSKPSAVRVDPSRPIHL
jgi:hypothetical protein